MSKSIKLLGNNYWSSKSYGITLYENINGTNLELEMVDSKENYSYIEIFFRTANNISNSVKIKSEESYATLETMLFSSTNSFIIYSRTINLNEKRLQLFLNGVNLTEQKKDGIYKIYTNNNFIGTGTLKEKKLKRDIIL